jgi:hypothetical protein
MRKTSQLTIRFDPELAGRVRAIARAEHLSLNQAALRLMRSGAGLDRRSDVGTVGSSLDHLFGTWTDVEARELKDALAWTEEIDEEMWRGRGTSRRNGDRPARRRPGKGGRG